MPAQAASHRPSSHFEPFKSPEAVLEEAEQQWLYTEDELQRTPSIVAGMSPEEERTLRFKGVNFITQVGMMLKLPQTTISTASVFFNRFLMRYSLVSKEGFKALHHYQIAAVSIFVATKVEEHSRKLKEIVIACCRVAQKNPVLLVDEQTKDYWRWKDTIVLNEDIMLELLCFDLTIESPYKVLYDLIKIHRVATNKLLRDTAWSFLNDSGMTQLCLLYPTRTIACAALYCGARRTSVAIEDDEKGRPWWKVHNVELLEIRKAYNHMASCFEHTPLKPGAENIYVGGQTPLHGPEEFAKTRLRREQAPATPEHAAAMGSESPKKRPRDEPSGVSNGNNASKAVVSSRVPPAALALMDNRSTKRRKTEEPEEDISHERSNGQVKQDISGGSEDGELEE